MLSKLILLVGLAGAWGSVIPTDRIVGGFSVAITQRPFQASIVLYGNHFCGGSIIGKDVILTAAHCLFGESMEYLQVRVGSTDRESGGKLIGIRKTLYHEQYNDATTGLDVGLIWLKEPLTFDSKVQMIALPQQDEKFSDGLMATVSGWGMLQFDGNLADTLQEVNVPIVNRDVCSQEYRGMINQDMICAGFDAGGKDACTMDSGGPLTVGNKQAGIVSFGYDCATPHFAGIYTNVAHFRNWIDQKILEDQRLK